jgi:hypothetical protein
MTVFPKDCRCARCPRAARRRRHAGGSPRSTSRRIDTAGAASSINGHAGEIQLCS